jgi:5-methylthioadenosine/S-adenosylhomocysteine deaminase
MGKEDVYYSALLANLEMIKGGMTCFCDPAAHPEFYDEHFRATEQAGIRGVITRSNITLSPSSYEIAKNMVDTPDDAIRKTLEMIGKWEGRGSGRLRPWLGVRHIMSATEEYLRKNEKEYQRLSKELKWRIGIKAHSAFVLNDDTVVKRTGKREIEWLDSLGVLGPQWLLAHAIWYSDQEVELLKKHDVKIVHCPGTSFHCGYGASKGKFLDMMKKGITVSIGPDAGWCNNELDMFLEMRHFAYMHKEGHMDGSAISAETALEVATLNGARAVLWEDEIGALKPGMKADVIIVDPWRPNSIPWQDYNLVKNLVYAINGTQVETVICNGKVLMEKRKVKTLDEKDILKKSQKLAAEVAARHPLKLKSEWPIV